MAYPQYDKSDNYAYLSYNSGPYYNDSEGVIGGTVDIHHFNNELFIISSVAQFTVEVYTNAGVLVRSKNYSYPNLAGDPVYLGAGEDYWEQYVGWDVSLSSLTPGLYYIKIRKYGEVDPQITGNTFQVQAPASSYKRITGFLFSKFVGSNENYWPVGLPDSIIGIVNENTKQITFEYPNGMDISNLAPTITLYDQYASVAPLSGTPQDFTSEVEYVVTAQDLTTVSYFVNGTGVGEANLFIYDNIYTRAVPATLERGDTVNWYCLLSNSGSVANAGTENLTVVLTDDQANYYAQIYQGAVGSINPYEDKEMSGQYVIPGDVPLGSTIKYFISFHLNASLIKRYVLISNWDESAKGIVYNKKIGAFVRETFSKSKFFANINKDFYSLGIVEGTNQVWYHNDNIADGSIQLYGQSFYPSLTFIVNKAKLEKIFDNIIMQMNDVGVTKIEYWTEDQYAVHEWPDQPLSQTQSRPWIDPEFREDKWYLPVHNEEIADYDYIADGAQPDGATVKVVNPIPLTMRSTGTITVAGNELEYVNIDYDTNEFILSENRGFAIVDQDPVIGIPGDMAKTREMRGTYMKVKITFKPLRKFTLKNVVTEFRESNI